MNKQLPIYPPMTRSKAVDMGITVATVSSTWSGIRGRRRSASTADRPTMEPDPQRSHHSHRTRSPGGHRRARCQHPGPCCCTCLPARPEDGPCCLTRSSRRAGSAGRGSWPASPPRRPRSGVTPLAGRRGVHAHHTAWPPAHPQLQATRHLDPLFAAREIATSTVTAACKPRHRHQEFRDVARDHRTTSAPPRHIHQRQNLTPRSAFIDGWNDRCTTSCGPRPPNRSSRRPTVRRVQTRGTRWSRPRAFRDPWSEGGVSTNTKESISRTQQR